MGGDSEEGGGGSFYWKLEATNVKEGKANCKHQGKKVDQDGSDEDGKIGEKFTVSIKVPFGVSPDDFLTQLKGGLTIDSGRVYFILPIEDDKKQVRVSWGQDNPNNRGKQTIPPPRTGTTTQA